MELSPEVISMVAASPLGVWIVGQWISSNMKRIDNIPKLVSEMQDIQKTLVKVELRIEQLIERKDADREEIVKLKENAKAVWRNIDDIKIHMKTQTQ